MSKWIYKYLDSMLNETEMGPFYTKEEAQRASADHGTFGAITTDAYEVPDTHVLFQPIKDPTQIVTTTEDNVLLAKYAGLESMMFTEWGRTYYALPGVNLQIELWRPDKNWDHIMMVVEKIEKEDLVSVIIKRTSCEIYYPHPGDNYKMNLISLYRYGPTKIMGTYRTCLYYVKHIKLHIDEQL